MPACGTSRLWPYREYKWWRGSWKSCNYALYSCKIANACWSRTKHLLWHSSSAGQAYLHIWPTMQAFRSSERIPILYNICKSRNQQLPRMTLQINLMQCNSWHETKSQGGRYTHLHFSVPPEYMYVYVYINFERRDRRWYLNYLKNAF